MGQKLNMPTGITSQSYDQLNQRLQPVSTAAPEANVDVLFDTATYLAAGSGRLSFFVNVNADLTLSNMELAGQLPAGTYFDVWRIFCDALVPLSATVADTAAGSLNDIYQILNVARAIFTFQQYTKPVGPIPLSMFGNSGAPEGFIGSGRAAAAGAVIQAGRMPDNGGWPVNGTIRLGPGSKFGAFLDFSAANIAVSQNVPLRITFLGVRYRRIG